MSVRSFSKTDRVYKYALDKHKKTVGQGRLLDKLRYYDKKTLEGINEMNTDFTKPNAQEKEKLKPIQHPVNIDAEDTYIIRHSVPPKNLTPYDDIPVDALAMLDLKCKESPQGSRFI